MITVEYAIGNVRIKVTAPTPSEAAQTLVMIDKPRHQPVGVAVCGCSNGCKAPDCPNV